MACSSFSVSQRTEDRRGRLGRCHDVLRLPSAVDDPVRIIRAAQIQLRRWRREVAAGPAAARQRHVSKVVGEIIAARESLLRSSIHVQAPQVGVNSSHAAAYATDGARQAGYGPRREQDLAVGAGFRASLIGGLDQLR